MTWSELAKNWNSNMRALMRRFPHADASALSRAKDAPVEMSRVVAQSHDLTEFEAREEMENWLFVQGLARDTADVRRLDAKGIAAE